MTKRIHCDKNTKGKYDLYKTAKEIKAKNLKFGLLGLKAFLKTLKTSKLCDYQSINQDTV